MRPGRGPFGCHEHDLNKVAYVDCLTVFDEPNKLGTKCHPELLAAKMLNKIEVPETFVAHSPQPKGGAIVVGCHCQRGRQFKNIFY